MACTQSSDMVEQDTGLGIERNGTQKESYLISTTCLILLFLQKYKQRLEKEFACIKEESTAQLMKAQHWEDWWKQSIQKIKQLYV